MKDVTYQMLVAYAAGELPQAEAARVQAHCAADPEAAATVARYGAARESLRSGRLLDPPPEVVARAREIFAPRPDPAPSRWRWWQELERVVAQLVFDSRLRPALAGYRGSGGGFQLAFSSGPLTIDLEAQPAGGPGSAERWRVMGQIDAGESPPGGDIALVSRGPGADSLHATADTHGLFALDAPAGRYDLFVRHAKVTLLCPDIDLE